MSIFLGASLVSSFIAGMIALFAPCCVSYLLPAYLGSVFKERKQVFLMTLVFSAGIFLVMFPVVLGFRALSALFLQYHNQTFLLGGIVMVLMGLLAFLGIKLPMISLSRSGAQKEKPDTFSIFTLGIFSGITSSCCAPVLFGVLTLSFLSPTFWQAALVALVYVLGIVTPLYLGAYFLDTRQLLDAAFFKRHLFDLKLVNKDFPVLMSNLIAALIFIPMGLLTIFLTLTGRLAMQEQAQQFGSWVGKLTLWTDNTLGSSLLVQGFFLLLLILTAGLLYRNWQKRNRLDSMRLDKFKL